MPRPLRTFLLLLLVLPAILVPRGVSLDWCLCGTPEDCCVATVPACCADEAGRNGPAFASNEDCSCCKRLEVDEFDQVVSGAPVEGVGAQPAHSAPPMQVCPPRVDARGVRCVPRAPPAHMTHAGLLPGTRPQLL